MRTPKMTKKEILGELIARGIDLSKEKICIVGIRGYYRDSMGARGRNDRGIYDDAMFVIAEHDFQAWAANVDPSVYRTGIATLEPGLYDVVKWRHRGLYPALQIVRDTVRRDGATKLDTGRHGINFHYAGTYTTGSEGCQTFPRPVWDFFIKKIYSLMQRYNKTSVKYLLITNE